MLSYRHAFHAGNHADVLKHMIEVEILSYLAQKTTPFWYIDTHAGAGIYSLTEGYATVRSEFDSGIGRLWLRRDLPIAVQTYMAAVRTLNPTNTLSYYPGSAWLAHLMTPQHSKLRLFELHPTDHRFLQQCFTPLRRRAIVAHQDGFEGIKAILPPPPRRALLLIDPPYENKQDYDTVPTVIQQSLKRFATGIYAIWYPLLQRQETRQLPEVLKKISGKRWLNVTLTIRSPSSNGFGMHGSGMFIVNPPWTLATSLEATMPWLVKTLAQDQSASFELTVQHD
jgi:23S rRNA (adenine2030-N6)-methyltransferase